MNDLIIPNSDKSEEGYIKFNCKFIYCDCITDKEIKEINYFRQKLFQAGFVGKDSNNISFGNISQRLQKRQFIITGSDTGGIEKLRHEHYSKVIAWDIAKNTVVCEGLIRASSETLSHAAIYDKLSGINAVIHIHHAGLWKQFIDILPTTKRTAEYGTVELAKEIQCLLDDEKTQKEKIIIMGGHEDGIIIFDNTLKEANSSKYLKVKGNLKLI